jgi:hypothetical protein
MALAPHRAGTSFKKCDRSNHKPDSTKRCASATCQHTCDNPERCACLDPALPSTQQAAWEIIPRHPVTRRGARGERAQSGATPMSRARHVRKGFRFSWNICS